MKRIISITLSFILVFTLCQLVLAEGGTVYNVNDQTTLTNALTAAQTGDTIKLTANITYNSTIVIEDKRITFYLNGYTLNVVNNAEAYTAEEMSGLYVKGNAAVALEGDGEFNVTGSWYGVFAECNEGESAEVTVTNATGIGRDGVAAQHSKVTVKGDATSSGSTYSGVWASYENAEVIVEGNVYANGKMSLGINTDTLALVTVKGSVIVDGDNSIGIKAGDDGDVTVEGDVTVSGSDCVGAFLLSEAGKASIVTIKGVIEAEKYILFEAEDESEWEYSLRDGDFDEETGDYIYYTYDNKSFVYVSMFAGGSGTAENPYLIGHASQLYNIKYYHFFGKHYKQIADIDLGGYFSLGEGWDPIGLGESPFLGVYDGDSHTISNLFINLPYQGDIGLFGCVGERSEILNVGLINADVTGRHEVGGLAAINAGLIANSYVTGKVSGTTYAGGLIGYNIGSVTDSYFDGTVVHVKGFDTDEVECAGGLVGDNFEEGSITGCYAKATVESEGPLIGGLAGRNLGSITDSHAISDVTGSYYVGGLTGNNGGIINNSYADGTVTGASQAGGLVGLNESLHPITDSYFTGTVTASDYYVGGLVGDNSGGSIEGCHANATVTSAGDYVGGLAGRSIGSITSSWSAGAVTGGSYVGGLVGASFVNAGSGEISEGITASYSDCAVEGEMYVGGLAGDNETPISESYATGDVTNAGEIDLTYTHFGGLVGKNTGPIGDSYAWGDVSGHQYVGGLIGYNEADVTNCYEIGAVSGNSNTGGLIGSNKQGTAITGSFWNNNTSGQDSSDGGISEGSVPMKQQVTYVNKGWKFNNIWDIDLVQPYAFNDGYPFLRWQVKAEFAGGSGTLEDPYLISSEDHLNNVRNHLDKHFRQTADLDLSSYRSGSGWAPIGTSANTFTGTYNGDGHTIGNLFIKQAGASNVRIPTGLFGYTGAEAEICNLALKSVDVTGCYYVGSLVGNNSGKISKLSVSGTVTGEWDTGGLVGLNKGTISLTTFTGAVTGADEIEYGDWTGGLVGYNYGTITRCWVDATVVSAGDNAGGLVGESLTGGIITESCSAGDVTAYDYSGGLAGANSGEITACYSLCTVKGDSDVGGLVGGNSGPIADSFAAGSVIGMNQTGGLVGSSTSATVIGCYWDTETSDQSASAGGAGKTTAEMKQRTTFENWDFVAIWDINAGFNDGYPFLRWQDDVPPVLSETGADSLTDTTATLNFTSDKSGIYYYLVYEAAEDAPNATAIKAQGEAAAKGTGIAEAAANNVTVTDLTASTEYKTYIIVEYAEGNTSDIAEIGFTTEAASIAPTVPTAPQDFTATPSDGQAALSWSAPASDGGAAISHYVVSSDNGGTWVTAATNTSHTFTGLTNGTVYTFKVRAVNSAGNGAEASATATPTATPAPTYTVTVINGTGGGEFAQGVTVTITANPAPSEQQFKEWEITPAVTFMDSTSKTDATAKFTMPAQAVEATATYEDIPENIYSITVQNDGNGIANADVNAAAQGTEVTLTATANPGYRFKEWQVSGNVTIADDKFIMPNDDVTIKAIFEAIPAATYTVTFNPNGGNVSPAGAETGADGRLTSLPTPTRSDYQFDGWFTAESGGTRITTDSVFTANTTIYAQWTYIIDPGIDECFIATAAFGSKFTGPVTLLRHFRDDYLLTSRWGTEFVNSYYRFSPPIANIIAGSESLRLLTRLLLAPVIILVYLLFNPLWIFIIMGLLLLICLQRYSSMLQIVRPLLKKR